MKNILTSCVLLIVFLTSCGLLKENPKPKTTATVVTDEISNITATSATVSGEVVTDGNTTVTERGFAFGTVMNPTFEVGKVSAGAGTGVFTADLTALTPGTLYHVRAYAINSKGVGYGDDRTFTTTVAVPTLTTTAATSITAISASIGGTITSDGGSAVTARGVCWNTTGNPTTADAKTTDGSGAGNFTSSLTGLKSNAKIYVRAYATNSIGTSYGNQVEVTTLKAVPSNGLVGWWPFNGNANDESGNGNNGVVNGASLTTDRNGKPNSAYSFNGVNNGIVTPDSNFPYGATDRTISFWMNDKSTGDYCSIPIRYGAHSNNNAFWLLHNNNCNSSYPLGLLIVDFFSTFVLADNNFQVPNNQWKMVTITIENQLCKLYLGSELIGQGSVSINTLPSGNSFYIGSDLVSTPNNYFFSGEIDDVIVYNRALTAQEVVKIYNSTGF